MSPRAKRLPAAPARDPGAAAAAGALFAALAASALLVDLGAEASFDAPKRLATLILIAIAAAAAFLAGGRGDSPARIWREAGRAPRAALLLAGAALAGAVLSALVSPRRAMALDGVRTILLFSLLLPLGASRALARHGRALLGGFLGLSAVNAAVSLLQGRQIYQPFRLEVIGSRDATGAFVGNVGYLALALALAAVASLAVALSATHLPVRLACAAAIPLFLLALVRNQNLTSLTALAAGGIVLLWARMGRRAMVPAAALVAITALAVGLSRPTLRRALDAAQAARSGNWEQVFSYRLGPWSSAIEMARDRPALGFGPGTFAAESVAHRLRAEIRARRRYVNPLLASSYGEAHSEPLQALAEGGVAGAAAIAAGLVLLAALGSAARRGGPSSPEAALLFAVLVAGLVSSLTWFPFQRPVTALPLLLAAGRGWRLAAERASAEAE